MPCDFREHFIPFVRFSQIIFYSNCMFRPLYVAQSIKSHRLIGCEALMTPVVSALAKGVKLFKLFSRKQFELLFLLYLTNLVQELSHGIGIIILQQDKPAFLRGAQNRGNKSFQAPFYELIILDKHTVLDSEFIFSHCIHPGEKNWKNSLFINLILQRKYIEYKPKKREARRQGEVKMKKSTAFAVLFSGAREETCEHFLSACGRRGKKIKVSTSF